MYIPFSNQFINVVEGTNIPSTEHSLDTRLRDFHERQLFQKICYTLDIKEPSLLIGNVTNFFKYILFSRGYCAIFDSDTYGLIFQPATIYGYNVYYQPTKVKIANPIFTGDITLEIDKDCSLIMLTPDYRGVWDIISYYAERLASIDTAILVQIANAKTPYIFTVKNKAMAESLKKMFDKIQSGEFAVFEDNAVFDKEDESIKNVFDLDVKNRYILDRLLADKRDILRQFDKDIGIPTLTTEKKERTTTNEVEASYISSQSLITMWYDCLNSTMKKTNEMFGTNFTVEKRLDVNQQNVVQGGGGYVVGENNNDRN